MRRQAVKLASVMPSEKKGTAAGAAPATADTDTTTQTLNPKSDDNQQLASVDSPTDQEPLAGIYILLSTERAGFRPSPRLAARSDATTSIETYCLCFVPFLCLIIAEQMWRPCVSPRGPLTPRLTIHPTGEPQQRRPRGPPEGPLGVGGGCLSFHNNEMALPRGMHPRSVSSFRCLAQGSAAPVPLDLCSQYAVDIRLLSLL